MGSYFGGGARPPGMPSPAPTNGTGAGTPPGWSSPFGLVSGYPVTPDGDVLSWEAFCTLYPHACPSNWRSLLGTPAPKPSPARPRPAPTYRPPVYATPPPPPGYLPPPPPIPPPRVIPGLSQPPARRFQPPPPPPPVPRPYVEPQPNCSPTGG